MKWNYNDPVFDDLLALNPWAIDLWGLRLDLIRNKTWNVNSINQGGNAETRAWLEQFFQKRSDATLARLVGPASDHDSWAREVGLIARNVFADVDLKNAWVGSSMQQFSDGSSLANTDSKTNEYTIGQFKADFLLLSQASLRALEIKEHIDISGRFFPIGLDLARANFLEPLNAKGTKFGPFSDHSSVRFNSADFSRSEFFDQAYFTMTKFEGFARFQDVIFHGPASFHATLFSKAAFFNGCRFEHSTGFCGAKFEEAVDFSEAVFNGDTTFEDSMFGASVEFRDSTFPGRVYVGRIPKNVKQRILDANHP